MDPSKNSEVNLAIALTGLHQEEKKYLLWKKVMNVWNIIWECWAEKKARIAIHLFCGTLDGWDLVSVLLKLNDDLHQETL